MTTDTQDGAPAEERAAGQLSRLLGALGVPVRQYLLAVGNATLASWSFAAATAFVAFLLWLTAFQYLEVPIRAANERALLELAEGRRLDNLKKAETIETQGPRASSWTLLATAVKADRVDFHAPVLDGAVEVFVLWEAPARQGSTRESASGSKLIAIPEGTPAVSWSITAADFGAEVWADHGAVLVFALQQRIPGEPPVDYRGVKQGYRVP